MKVEMINKTKLKYFKNPQQSFAFRTKRDPETGCLNWVGATNKLGYGIIRNGSKMQYAHRYAYEQLNGLVPDGVFICHRCDNTSCCNSDHLFIGDHQDNMDDMVNKGRQANGERNGNAKLIETDVIAIRADTRLQREIAVDYGVGKSTIGKVKMRKLWNHI
ncbi:MAG: HNH endonuclease [Colwellia sp.]|nr:HNH endonuclease [Colwellia sp.]